jgi:glutamate synthase (NADPH) small chain
MSSDSTYRNINRGGRARSIPIAYFKRDVEDRILDFDEVILGYDDETAMAEASRCVQCPEPQCCVINCPANNDIPEAIWKISEGKFIEAAQIFARTNPLTEICGRVCPNLCQTGCVLSQACGSASIGKLEAFVANKAREAGAMSIPVPEEKTGKKIAVVGSGPAGITVAEDLVKLGHVVTIYEAWPVAGGVLVYGIPNFKLDKEVVGYKINDLIEAGVTIKTNTRIGDQITIEELQEQYDAVFLGTGAGVEATMDIPGEDLTGVYKSTDFLVRANVPQHMLPPDKKTIPDVGKRVAVIGGGDTAVDCARTAVRLGAEEVTIVYRRTEAEMPGNKGERAICLEEGVTIEYLQAPVEYFGDDDGVLKEMMVIEMELGAPDQSGRRRPVTVEGSEFMQEVDTVVLAVGYWPDPALGKKTEGLKTYKWGLFLTDESIGATSRKGVFAAGDNVHGPDLVITAVTTAHKAAKSIDAYLKGESIPWVEA